MHAPGWVASDCVFTPEFYKPYESAAETAFLMLCAIRNDMCESDGMDAVRAMTFRLKSPGSIRDKLQKKGLPSSTAAAGAALHDIAGLRVVLSDVSAVYRFAEKIRSSPIAQFAGARDYIASPKPSGYRSLHLLMLVPVHLHGQSYMIPVEIQLRTASMDIWASAEHDICYKPARASSYAP